MRINKKLLIVVFALFFSFISLYSKDESFIKNRIKLKTPTEFRNNKHIRSPKESNIFKGFEFVKYPILQIVKFYKSNISEIKGENCRMFPSCSEYGYIAIQKYPLRGILMTTDRLLRCGHDLENYKTVIVGNSIRFYDPPTLRRDR